MTEKEGEGGGRGKVMRWIASRIPTYPESPIPT
jgi:hypothetical protein